MGTDKVERMLDLGYSVLAGDRFASWHEKSYSPWGRIGCPLRYPGEKNNNRSDEVVIGR